MEIAHINHPPTDFFLMENSVVSKPPKLEIKLLGCSVSAEGFAAIVAAVVVIGGVLVFYRF